MTELLAADQIGLPILGLMILLPILIAIALYFVPTAAQQRSVAMGGALVVLLLGLIVLWVFEPGAADAQLAQKAQWIPSLGASFHIGVDGVSAVSYTHLTLPTTPYV